MTQYEVITVLIIHMKESVAIFCFLDTKHHICETDKPSDICLTDISIHQQHRCHNEPYSQTNTAQKY